MNKKFSFLVVLVLSAGFLVTSSVQANALTCTQKQQLVASAVSRGDLSAAAQASRLSCSSGSSGSGGSSTTLTCTQRSLNIANALTRGDVDGAAFWQGANCTGSSSGGGSNTTPVAPSTPQSTPTPVATPTPAPQVTTPQDNSTLVCRPVPQPNVVATQNGSSVRFDLSHAYSDMSPYSLSWIVNYWNPTAGTWSGWSQWVDIKAPSGSVELTQPSPEVTEMWFAALSIDYCGISAEGSKRIEIKFESQAPAQSGQAPAQSGQAPAQSGQAGANPNSNRTPGSTIVGGSLKSPLQAPASIGELAEPKGVAQISGRATQLDVFQGTASGSATLNYATPTAELKVSLLPQMGTIISSEGVSQLELKRGQAVEFSGSSLMKDTYVQAWLPKSNSEIGRFKVGSNGIFSGNIDLKESRLTSSLTVGEQTVQFTGVDETGNRVVISAPIKILQPDIAPELIMGQTPFIPNPEFGKLINTAGGKLSEASLDINETRNELSVSGDGWVLAVALSGSEGVLAGDRNNFQLELSKNEPVDFAGNGFMPGTVASIWLFSDPVKLGEVTVLEDGSFSGVSDMVLSSVAGGEHTLQLQGVRSDGILVSANLGVALQSGPFDFLFTGITNWQLPEEFGVGSVLLTVFLLFQVTFLVFWYLRRAKSSKVKLGKASKTG